jgi:uncharacterized protein (TIGR02466 family)
MKGNLVPLFPTLVYQAQRVVNEEWLEKTKQAMLEIKMSPPELKVQSEGLDVKVESKELKSFFGDSSNHSVFDIDIDWLLSQVKIYMEDYLREMQIPVNRYNIHVQKWWPVVTTTEGTVAKHTHVNSHFSVVYYVSVPQVVDKDPGSLSFYSDDSHWGRHVGLAVDDRGSGDSFARFTPETGDLVIFPSTLHHSVSPNMYDEKRLSISMDITLTRNETHDPKRTDEMSLPDPSNWITL